MLNVGDRVRNSAGDTGTVTVLDFLPTREVRVGRYVVKWDNGGVTDSVREEHLTLLAVQFHTALEAALTGGRDGVFLVVDTGTQPDIVRDEFSLVTVEGKQYVSKQRIVKDGTMMRPYHGKPELLYAVQ